MTTTLRTRTLTNRVRVLPRSYLPPRPSRIPPTAIPFSTTPSRPSGDDHGSHYDPPTGWLWGIPPGQKYEKEGWEGIWYYGFFGSIGVAAVAYAFKPDTSIETWALEEATRRLQREGVLPDEEGEGS